MHSYRASIPSPTNEPHTYPRRDDGPEEGLCAERLVLPTHDLVDEEECLRPLGDDHRGDGGAVAGEQVLEGLLVLGGHLHLQEAVCVCVWYTFRLNTSAESCATKRLATSQDPRGPLDQSPLMTVYLWYTKQSLEQNTLLPHHTLQQAHQP